MSIDEQWEQFEEWQATRPWEITESAYDLAFAAWLARDAEVQALREALRDMLSGWHYIRANHGDLYGVGWERAQAKAETALAGEKGSSDD